MRKFMLSYISFSSLVCGGSWLEECYQQKHWSVSPGLYLPVLGDAVLTSKNLFVQLASVHLESNEGICCTQRLTDRLFIHPMQQTVDTLRTFSVYRSAAVLNVRLRENNALSSIIVIEALAHKEVCVCVFDFQSACQTNFSLSQALAS